MEKNKKNIAIVGALGFVGYHLTKKLKELGHEVVGFDNLSTGTKKNQVKGVEYIIGDSWLIGDYMLEYNIEKPDIVYHLGEYSRVLPSFKDISDVVDYNILGTVRVVEYCRENKVRLIYAGSSTRFGNADSPYAFTKKQNAELIKRYGKWFGLDYAIAYFYNVYGPRQIEKGKYATVIGIFKDNLKWGLPHKINAPGTQKRIFTHVDDIVDALILIGEKGKGEYCLGSKDEYSIKQVAKMFGGSIEMVESKKGDRDYSKIDLKRINKLGWKAKRKLREYISSLKQKE